MASNKNSRSRRNLKAKAKDIQTSFAFAFFGVHLRIQIWFVMNLHLSHTPGPIGVFDSGYGGLTILDKIREVLPEYDYIYLGDNARAPYGTRSFEVVYEFTRQAVCKLFDMGCHLVILAWQYSFCQGIAQYPNE